MSSSMTDIETLSKATAGDRDALEQLLLAHCPRVSRDIASKIPTSLQSILSVDDILQQTLLQTFKNIGRFKPRTTLSFSVWLQTIAENELNNTVTALTRQKRGGSHRRLVVPPPSAQSRSLIDLVELLSDGRGTPSQSAMRRESVEVIQVAIACLPSDQREAINLLLIQGESLQETAKIMAKTTNAVRSLRFTVRRRS